ncbi:hypothetical protein FSARC_10220 [Fusarium sarcochroum]|uniref:Fungal N-terminal domain-containing protein n=1 Tax=Fusarium sarcochroum TaxID=1208366 RepID=A0A8H4TNJ8_9HYPO|nr:hypothetical protein FSARC_10220 [Fusarium sarcochroum]
MAEALGVIASVATIAALARPTARFVKSLKGIATDQDPISREIRRMASRIELSSTTIDIALQELKGHCASLKTMQDARSEVVRYIVENKSTDVLVRCSKAIKKQLIEASERLDAMEGRAHLIKRLKWFVWTKLEVESLFPEMQHISLCLVFVCPLLKLEINQYLLERTTDQGAQCMRQEIKSLRNQLKICEKQYRIMARDRDSSTGYDSAFNTEFQSIAEPLLRLSKSMRRTGTIPQGGGVQSPSRSSASQEPFMQIPSELSTHVHQNESSEGVPTEYHREMPQKNPRSRSSRVSSSSQIPETFPTPPVTYISRSSHTPDSGNLEVPRESLSTSSRRTSSSRHSRSSLPSTSSQTAQTPETPRTPQTPQKPEFPRTIRNAVPSSTKGQNSEVYRATSGYIASNGSGERRTRVRAIIDTTFSDNYISIRAAQELGFDIMELESQHPSHVHSVGGKASARIMGKVSGVKWQKKEYSKPVMLDFWVKEFYLDVGEQLVFGKDFVQMLEKRNQAVW